MIYKAAPFVLRNLTFGATVSIWLAANLVVPTIMTGQQFIPDSSPATAKLAVFLGTFIGCFVLSLVAML